MSDNQKIRDYFITWMGMKTYITVEELKRFANIKQGVQSIGRYMRRLEVDKFLDGRKREGKSYKEYHLHPQYHIGEVNK